MRWDALRGPEGTHTPQEVLGELPSSLTGPVFSIVTGEPFKQLAELTGEPIKMKA